MKYMIEKIVAFFLFITSLFFLYRTNIKKEMLFYMMSMDFSGISLMNLLLFVFFFSSFIALISCSSVIKINKKNMIFIGLMVFMGCFCLIGLSINPLYNLMFSSLIGCCFYWFMRNISNEVDEYKHVNYMRAFILMKSNMHKCFFLVSLLIGLLVSMLVLNIPDAGKLIVEKSFSFENKTDETNDILTIAKEMQKQNSEQTAKATGLWISQYVYNDESLKNTEKQACLDSINRSSIFVTNKINQTYAEADIENITETLELSGSQNQIFKQANLLINAIENYYFLLAGLIVFFMVSFVGSIIALIASLIGVIFLKIDGSLDVKKKAK